MDGASIHNPDPSLGPLLLKRTCMVSFTHPALPQLDWLSVSSCHVLLGGKKGHYIPTLTKKTHEYCHCPVKIS